MITAGVKIKTGVVVAEPRVPLQSGAKCNLNYEMGHTLTQE